MPDRRSFIAGAAALMAARPAHGAAIPLAGLSRYLNGLQTAVADFTQINDDGTISTGTFYIKRPGRCRFEYAAPDNTLVMVGGGSVAIFDGKSNRRTPEQYPLSRTPLAIILERNVDLARRGMVAGHRAEGPQTIVTARDPENPGNGSIDLVFTDGPVELRQWIVTDGAGARTTVILGDMTRGGDLSSTLFNIGYEVNRRAG